METPESEYRSLLEINFDALESEPALGVLAKLIDFADDFRHLEGTNLAIQIGEQIAKRSLTPAQTAILNYYLSNAWETRSHLDRTESQEEWKWEQPEIEKQIIHLRRALIGGGFQHLETLQRCQIFTNLGNHLNSVGRFVEAIWYWDKAIELFPLFGMAIGNRGRGLIDYSKLLYDNGHQQIFFRHAYVGLRTASDSDPENTYPWARDGFSERLSWLESFLVPEFLNHGTQMKEFPLGDSENEIKYRQWCLSNSLFLNPLNDLGPYSIAAHDVLSTPSIVVKAGEGMRFQGMYNQLKQEYASARFLSYEGMTSTKPHFSDKGVLLINTLDYPCYSLAVEKVKMAFRMAYSLLDKAAYFLNNYLALGIPERMVNFHTFWYIKQKRQSSFDRNLKLPTTGRCVGCSG